MWYYCLLLCIEDLFIATAVINAALYLRIYGNTSPLQNPSWNQHPGPSRPQQGSRRLTSRQARQHHHPLQAASQVLLEGPVETAVRAEVCSQDPSAHQSDVCLQNPSPLLITESQSIENSDPRRITHFHGIRRRAAFQTPSRRLLIAKKLQRAQTRVSPQETVVPRGASSKAGAGGAALRTTGSGEHLLILRAPHIWPQGQHQRVRHHICPHHWPHSRGPECQGGGRALPTAACEWGRSTYTPGRRH